MARLAGVFTKVSYSGGDPSDDDAAAAWAEVDALTSPRLRRHLLRRWRRRISPVNLLGRA